MYRRVIKPVLFSLTIEQAHHAVLLLLRIIGLIPGGRWLLRKCYAVEHPALEREVFGIRFANPIGLAAGFDHNGEAFRELAALGFGFVEVGTVTPRPQAGNPRPRVFRLPKDNAIINRIGLANRGLEATIRHLRRPHDGVIVGCNIGKTPRPPPRTLRRTTSNSSAASTSMRTISPSTSAATTPAAKARRTRANISFRYSTRCSTSGAGRTSSGRSCSKSRPTCRTR